MATLQTLQLPLSFRSGCRGAEAKALTNLQLAAAIDVWIDDVGDNRVASGHRVVCQEQHGLAGRRDLERSSEHSLAYEFASVRSLTRPDLTTFCRLEELGLKVTGQRLEPDRAVLACRVAEPDQWCRRCGCEGSPRDTVVRQLAHEPLGWRPTTLEVTIRRYQCSGCGHVWRQDTTRAAAPRAKLSRRGLRWALEGISIDEGDPALDK